MRRVIKDLGTTAKCTNQRVRLLLYGSPLRFRLSIRKRERDGCASRKHTINNSFMRKAEETKESEK